MPSSLQARMTRKAISPRLAIRILWNMLPLWSAACQCSFGSFKSSTLHARRSQPFVDPCLLFWRKRHFRIARMIGADIQRKRFIDLIPHGLQIEQNVGIALEQRNWDFRQRLVQCDRPGINDRSAIDTAEE